MLSWKYYRPKIYLELVHLNGPQVWDSLNLSLSLTIFVKLAFKESLSRVIFRSCIGTVYAGWCQQNINARNEAFFLANLVVKWYQYFSPDCYKAMLAQRTDCTPISSVIFYKSAMQLIAFTDNAWSFSMKKMTTVACLESPRQATIILSRAKINQRWQVAL